MKHVFIAAACLVAVPFSAQAELTTLTATGTIFALFAQQGTEQVTVPAGLINNGDEYELTATFDLSLAQLSDLYDADPTMNLYALPGATVSLRIGAYESQLSLNDFVPSYLEIWNDHFPNPVAQYPYDAQRFQFSYAFGPDQQGPFELGDGVRIQSMSIRADDPYAWVRDNDLIEDLLPMEAFSSRTFSFGTRNLDTGLMVVMYGTADNAHLATASVPEPATWAMMIAGFGLVGASMRRRQIRRAISFG